MTNMILFTLQYNELTKRFNASRQEMEYELPEDNNAYIMVDCEWFGFLTKYKLNTLGTINTDRKHNRAFYLDIFDPDKNYRPLYLEMKDSLVKQTKEEAEKIMTLAKALEDAGI